MSLVADRKLPKRQRLQILALVRRGLLGRFLFGRVRSRAHLVKAKVAAMAPRPVLVESSI